MVEGGGIVEGGERGGSDGWVGLVGDAGNWWGCRGRMVVLVDDHGPVNPSWLAWAMTVVF